MRKMTITFNIFNSYRIQYLCFILFCSAIATFSESLLDETKDYLHNCCDYSDTLSPLLSKDRKNPLIEMNLPATRKFLPNRHFYFTELETGYYEYPMVEVIVSVEKLAKLLDVSICYSPLFADSCSSIRNIYIGIKVSNDSQMVNISKEIAGMFEKITFGGSLRNEAFSNYSYSADLFHTDQLWRKVLITFNTLRRIESISLVNLKTIKGHYPLDSIAKSLKVK
jgi:hypothetical protein